jgi:hypothetical protein
MSIITVYTFEKPDGTEDTFTTQDPKFAKDRGERNGMRVIANTYQWSDSELAWDFAESDAFDVGQLTAGDVVEVETTRRATITGPLVGYLDDPDGPLFLRLYGTQVLYVRNRDGEPGVDLRDLKLIKKGPNHA